MLATCRDAFALFDVERCTRRRAACRTAGIRKIAKIGCRFREGPHDVYFLSDAEAR